MTTDAPVPTGNPFATRYTRPDAGEYLFPTDANADCLVVRLCQFGWWGQITGPHGSGKSTLVQTLLPRLEAAGRSVQFYLFQPTPPRHGRAIPSRIAVAEPLAGGSRSQSLADLRRASTTDWNSRTQIVVDGYEQLSWLRRTWLKRRCRRRQAGLLVTAHGDLGLPPLWQTGISMELARRVVARLLNEHAADWLDDDQVQRLLARHGGNLREVLFQLYDLFEQHQRG